MKTTTDSEQLIREALASDASRSNPFLSLQTLSKSTGLSLPTLRNSLGKMVRTGEVQRGKAARVGRGPTPDGFKLADQVIQPQDLEQLSVCNAAAQPLRQLGEEFRAQADWLHEVNQCMLSGTLEPAIALALGGLKRAEGQSLLPAAKEVTNLLSETRKISKVDEIEVSHDRDLSILNLTLKGNFLAAHQLCSAVSGAQPEEFPLAHDFEAERFQSRSLQIISAIQRLKLLDSETNWPPHQLVSFYAVQNRETRNVYQEAKREEVPSLDGLFAKIADRSSESYAKMQAAGGRFPLDSAIIDLHKLLKDASNDEIRFALFASRLLRVEEELSVEKLTRILGVFDTLEQVGYDPLRTNGDAASFYTGKGAPAIAKRLNKLKNPYIETPDLRSSVCQIVTDGKVKERYDSGRTEVKDFSFAAGISKGEWSNFLHCWLELHLTSDTRPVDVKNLFADLFRSYAEAINIVTADRCVSSNWGGSLVYGPTNGFDLGGKRVYSKLPSIGRVPQEFLVSDHVVGTNEGSYAISIGRASASSVCHVGTIKVRETPGLAAVRSQVERIVARNVALIEGGATISRKGSASLSEAVLKSLSEICPAPQNMPSFEEGTERALIIANSLSKLSEAVARNEVLPEHVEALVRLSDSGDFGQLLSTAKEWARINRSLDPILGEHGLCLTSYSITPTTLTMFIQPLEGSAFDSAYSRVLSYLGERTDSLQVATEKDSGRTNLPSMPAVLEAITALNYDQKAVQNYVIGMREARCAFSATENPDIHYELDRAERYHRSVLLGAMNSKKSAIEEKRIISCAAPEALFEVLSARLIFGPAPTMEQVEFQKTLYAKASYFEALGYAFAAENYEPRPQYSSFRRTCDEPFELEIINASEPLKANVSDVIITDGEVSTASESDRRRLYSVSNPSFMINISAAKKSCLVQLTPAAQMPPVLEALEKAKEFCSQPKILEGTSL